MKYEIKVSGMTCGGCAGAITKALKAVDPQADVSVDLASQLVKVKSGSAPEALALAVEEAGFSVLATTATA